MENQHQHKHKNKHKNNFKIWQQNINGFYSKAELIELLCKCYEPNICLFQELFRSHETIKHNKQLNNHSYFDNMYKMVVSHTGRAAILHKKDDNNYKQLSFDKLPKIDDKWNQCGFETVWVELQHPGNQSIIFCSLYRDRERKQIQQHQQQHQQQQDQGAEEELQESEAEQQFDLQRFIDEFRAAKQISPNIIIGGDFNCKHWLWGSQSDDEIGDQLAQFIWNHNLQVMNETHWGPTCRKKTSETGYQQGSFVDITLATAGVSHLIGNWICGNYYYEIASDHEPITCEMHIDELNCKLFDKTKTRTVWNFKQANWQQYDQAIELDMEDWVNQFDPIWRDEDKNNVPAFEQALKEWYKIVNTVANNYVGKKQVTPRATRFWSQRATQLKKKVIELNKQRKKDKDNDKLYQQYIDARKHYKKVVKNQKNQHHKQLFKTINDPQQKKQMFGIVRRLTRNKILSIGHLESSQPTVNSQGEPIPTYATTTPEKAEILANRFAQPPQPPEDETSQHQQHVEQFLNKEINPLRKEELLHEDEKQHYELDGYECFDDDEEEHEDMEDDLDISAQEQQLKLLNRPITFEEVMAARRHVGGCKASGPDNIHNKLLKQGQDYFNQSLQILFNWSYKIGYMPKQWKLCNIAPIPKPGRDHTKAKNYRPIALLSCVGKLMERLLSQRLLKYLKQTHLLSENQAGFQSYHNTYELLLKLTEHVYQSYRNNSILEAVFLDISSAYDSVWRDGLRYKLRNNFQITGRFYWWIDSFFNNRKGRVVIDGIKSEWKPFQTGVPQGSSLSPLLFIMYINDIENVIQIESQLGMFADDVALWTQPTDSQIENMEIQHQQLQKSLENISQWCTKWKLLLAENKTQYIVFKSPQKKKIPTQDKLTIQLNNTTIEPQQKVKYLGLYLDPYLNFKPHIKQYLLPKVMKRVGWLKYITNLNGGYPHVLVYQSLYKMLLRPAIDYASPFWNGATTSTKQTLQKVQRISLNRGMKMMKNVSYDATNVINYVEPLKLRCKHEELKLFKRCRVYSANFPNHTLSQVYKFWADNAPTDGVFNFKLSVLTRASINMHLYGITIPTIEELEQQPKIQQMPQLIKLPRPTNTPYSQSWPDKSYHDVLSTFEDGGQRTVIFTDGSCPINPGYGGAGVVVCPPHNGNKLQLSYPIDGITTNIAAEIAAIKKAIEWIDTNINHKQHRIVIFSDCKTVINSILNRSNPQHYGHAIRSIQKQITKLTNVPEIYWMKAHVGIQGNELADTAAKRAAQTAMEQSQPCCNYFGLSVADEAQHLSSVKIGEKLLKRWNKQWIKPIDANKHKHTKQIIPTIEFARDLFHRLLVTLETPELRVISRLISGHVNLRWYMNSIHVYDDPYCRYCGYFGAQREKEKQLEMKNKNKNKNKKNKSTHWSDQLLSQFDDDPTAKREETIEHYFFNCAAFNKQRNQLFDNILNDSDEAIKTRNQITIQLLLTGYPCKKWKTRRKIVQHTISFVKQTNRMNI